MIKTIARYLILILLICGGFYLVNVISTNVDNTYSDVSDITFNTNHSYYCANYDYDGIDQTIVYRNDRTNEDIFSDSNYAFLIDETTGTVYAAHNIYQRMYPASMTKLVTAMVVCDKINSGEINENDLVTIDNHYDLTYEGVPYFDMETGYQITVKNLLYELLIISNNYYALVLADYVAGSEEEFCKLMNQKMQEIGATNTHFVNPHGLDDPEHYSTAYDMYLITKEANTYELINKINTCDEYFYYFFDQYNEPIECSITAGNLFYNDIIPLPANFEITNWKTGTTSGAGYCLTLRLTKDDHVYYAVASHDESRIDMYETIVKLLCLVE